MKQQLSTLALLLAVCALSGCAATDDAQLANARKETQINNAAKAQDELSRSVKANSSAE